MAELLSHQGVGRTCLRFLALPCLAAGLLLMLCAAKKPPVRSYSPDDYSEIRVVLSDSKTYAEIGGTLSWEVKGKDIGDSTAVANIKLVDSNTVKLMLGKKPFAGGRIIATPKKGFLRYGSKEYRGRIEFYPSKDGETLIVLNVLPLEEYLLGVVPSEMPPGWPAEALKAQAVAARSYAAFSMHSKRQPDREGWLATYDVYPDTSDQVYKGVSGEDPRSTKAVRDTSGVILTWQGQPIFAQFCADAGGCTKCGSQPYLQSVPSYCPDSPHNDWEIRLSPDKLASLASAAGSKVGTVREVRAENDPQSGHLKSLKIIGDSGSQAIGGNKLRDMLGLSTMKSTRAYVTGPGGSELEPDQPDFKASTPAKSRPQPQPMESVDVAVGAGGGFIPDEDVAPDDEEDSPNATGASTDDETDEDAEYPAPDEQEPQMLEVSMIVNVENPGQLEDSARPIVLYRDGVADMKLRSAVVYDGKGYRKPGKSITVLGYIEQQQTTMVEGAAPRSLPRRQDEAARPSADDEAAAGTDEEGGDIETDADSVAEPPAGRGRQPQQPVQPKKMQPRFSVARQPKSEIPPSSRVKVGKDGIVLHGSGYGHGVGLSQWGARELADEGLDYMSILLHFYSGVDVLTYTPQGSSSAKASTAAAQDPPEAAEADAGEAVDVFYQPLEKKSSKDKAKSKGKKSK